jgi:hypothetical protein
VLFSTVGKIGGEGERGCWIGKVGMRELGRGRARGEWVVGDGNRSSKKDQSFQGGVRYED